ncbi:MAG: hypothetical protein Ta2B_25460 [Termitinemataceae bacterium]|nr:MAG: hypothetical protein Ta2B_25460 [Termitinemataceae bacterium]
MKKQKYQSKLLGVIYEDALADYKLGIITESEMHEYERDCLAAEEVKHNSFSSRQTPVRRSSTVAAPL